MRRTALLGAGSFAGFAVVLMLVVTRWRPLRRLDLDIAADLNAAMSPHPALVTTWKVVSEIGQPFTFQVLAVLTAVLLWRRGRAATAVFTAATVVLAGLVSNIVKWSVGRPRPDVADPLTHAAGTSFPSGHALSSMAGVTVLLLVLTPLLARRARTVATAAGVLVVAVIGFSRLALGVHYVSDVTAGWLLGLGWALAAYTVLRVVSPRAQPSPAPAEPDRLPGTPSG